MNLIYLKALIGSFELFHAQAFKESPKWTTRLAPKHMNITVSPAARILGSPWGRGGFSLASPQVALYGPAAKYFQDQMNLGAPGSSSTQTPPGLPLWHARFH